MARSQRSRLRFARLARHDRDAEPGRDAAQRGVDIGDLDAMPDRLVRQGRRPAQRHLHDAAGQDLDLLVGERVDEGDALSPRERMRRRHRHAQVVAPVRQRGQPREVARVPAHAEVGDALAHAADDFARHALLEAHAHRLVAREKAGDVVRQRFGQHRQAREHAHAAVGAGRELRQLGAHGLHKAEDLACLA